MGEIILKAEHARLFDAGIPEDLRVGRAYPVTIHPTRFMDDPYPRWVPPTKGPADPDANNEGCTHHIGRWAIQPDGRARVMTCSVSRSGDDYFRRVSFGHSFIAKAGDGWRQNESFRDVVRSGRAFALVAYHTPQVREIGLYSGSASCGVWV